MATALLIAGCQMGPPKAQFPPIQGKQDTALLTITGSADNMKMFDTRLRQLLAVGPEDSDTLGCKNCEKVQQGTAVSELVYIIPRRPDVHFQHIGTAWKEVWYSTNPPQRGGWGAAHDAPRLQQPT